MFKHFPWPVLTGGAVAAGIFLSSPIPAAPARAPSDVATVSQRLWGALLTHCGTSYVYTGSVLDGSGMLANVQTSKAAFIEFKGVRFHSVNLRVTDAERQNGVSNRARITMISHLYRQGSGQWVDGPDLQPRNTDDIFGKVLAQAEGDMFDMGSGGAIALEVVRVRGLWAVARSSATDGDLGLSPRYYSVDKLISSIPHRSCEVSLGQ